jgi:hypothetical protein
MVPICFHALSFCVSHMANVITLRWCLRLVCMYVRTYKGRPKTGPNTATFNDLLRLVWKEYNAVLTSCVYLCAKIKFWNSAEVKVNLKEEYELWGLLCKWSTSIPSLHKRAGISTSPRLELFLVWKHWNLYGLAGICRRMKGVHCLPWRGGWRRLQIRRMDLLFSLEVRVSGNRFRGHGFYSWPYQIFWVVGGLEPGPLSLVRTIEELLEWKSSGFSIENRDKRLWEFVALTTQHPCTRKSWH